MNEYLVLLNKEQTNAKINLATARIQLRNINVLSFPYMMTEDEIELLTDFFKRPVTMNNTFESSHPVAASLNYFANKQAYEEAEAYGNFIDIGSDLRNLDSLNVHHCVLVDTNRDSYRYLSRLANDDSVLAKSIVKNLTINQPSNFRDARVCLSGTQNCCKRARCMVAVNSLYDITFEQIYRAFSKHNAELLIAYMYLPPELIDISYAKINKSKFYRFIIKDDYAYFCFPNDMSFVYKHKFSSWRKFVTTTMILGPKFNIVIEVIRSYGPFCKLYFRRVPINLHATPERFLPMSDWFKDYVFVPNLRYVIASDFQLKFKQIPLIPVKKHIAIGCYRFICGGPDNVFSFERAATHFRGMCSRIVIGTTVVHEDAELDTEDYDDVLLSLVLLGAISRVRRTKTIGKMINNMDNSFEYGGGFLDALKETIHNNYVTLKTWIFGNKLKHRTSFNVDDSIDFMMIMLKHISDNIVSDTYVVHGYEVHDLIQIDHATGLRLDLNEQQSEPQSDDSSSSIQSSPSISNNVPNEFPAKPTTHIEHTAIVGSTEVQQVYENVQMQYQKQPEIIRRESESQTVNPSSLQQKRLPDKNKILNFINSKIKSSVSMQNIASKNEDFIFKSTRSLDKMEMKFPDPLADRCDSESTIVSEHYVPEERKQLKLTFDSDDDSFAEVCEQNETLEFVGERMTNINMQTPWLMKKNEAQPIITSEHEVDLTPTCSYATDKTNLAAQFLKDAKISNAIAPNEVYQNKYHFRDVTFNLNIDSAKVAEVNRLSRQISNLPEDWKKLQGYFPSQKLIDLHFQSRAAAKCSDIIKVFNIRYNTALDFAIAPGYCGKILQKKKYKPDGLHFVGPDALELLQGNIKQYYRVRNFNNETLTEVLRESNRFYDFIFSDAYSTMHKNAINNAFKTLKYLQTNGTFVYKTLLTEFMPQYFYKDFQSVNMYRSKFSTEVNFEIYIVCRGYKQQRVVFEDFDIIANFYIDDIIKCAKMLLQNNAINNFVCDPGDYHFKKCEVIIKQTSAAKFLAEISTTKTNKEEHFEDLFKELRERFKPQLFNKQITFKYNIMSGVFGCGKSNVVREQDDDILIIVPTRELANSYSNFTNVYTPHTALLVQTQFKRVYVDECWMFDLGYYYALTLTQTNAEFFLMGDPRQIAKVDFAQVGLSKDDLIPYEPHSNTISMRVPIDVCSVAEKYNYKVQTTNPRMFSISVFNGSYKDFVLFTSNAKIPTITARQLQKSNFSSTNMVANTIHEKQGYTHTMLAFYMDYADNILLQRSEYIIVSLSRHTDRLIIYGECNSFKTSELIFYSSNLRSIVDRAIMPIVDSDVTIEKEQDKIVLKKEANQSITDNIQVQVSSIMHTIDKVVDTVGVNTAFSAIHSTAIPLVQQGRAHVKPEALTRHHFPVTGRAFGDANTCKRYDSKDKFATVSTAIARYGIKSKMFNSLSANVAIGQLKVGYSKWLKFDVGSIEFINHFKTTPEEVTRHFRDYVASMQRKGVKPSELEPNYDEMFINNGIATINFFMKKQNKFKASQNFFESMKAGQGVNSWHKLLNVIYSTYGRIYSEKLKTALKDNVIFCNDENDARFGEKFGAVLKDLQENSIKHTKVENDFTEWDRCNTEPNIRFGAHLLSYVGLPPEFEDFYVQHRMYWKTKCVNVITLHGEVKQHSGQSLTLLDNTNNNMALSGILFEIVKLYVAGFKGDDDSIIAEEIIITARAKEIIEQLGFKTKLFERDVIEFTGYVITPCGYYPDMIRRAVKMLSQVFADEESFEKYQLAMLDYVRMIDEGGHELQLTGRAYLCQYYNTQFAELGLPANSQNMITEPELECIENFMRNSLKMKYSDLVKYDKNTIYVATN
jgi:23S rRNA U2552 (ribose-2'-O)-methylase RlmE/FtsJ